MADSKTDGVHATVYVPEQDSYLRLGAPDTVREADLGVKAQKQNGAGADKGSWPSGGVLFSLGPIHIVSPKIVTSAPAVSDWSSDKLSVVHDGTQLFSASHVQAGVIPYFNGPSTTSFQRTDTYTNTLGTAQTFTTGQTLSYANGFIAAMSVGGSMRASVGITTNLFMGQVVNFTKNGAELAGDYAYRSVKSQAIAVGETLRLSANADNIGTTTAGNAVLTSMGRVIGVIAGIVGATSLTWDGVMLGDFASTSDESEDDRSNRIKKEMLGMRISLQIATALVDVVQAAAVVYSLVLRIQKAAAPVNDLMSDSSVIKLTPSAVIIKGGTGGHIEINATGIILSGLAIQAHGLFNHAGAVPIPVPPTL